MASLGKLDKITHHLSVCGHNYLPCDRLFGIIGDMQKKHEKVEMYTEEIKERFDVISMSGSLFRDFKGHFGKI
jgi:hypothetical protein